MNFSLYHIFGTTILITLCWSYTCKLADSFLASALDNSCRVGLLVESCTETGAWLNAFLITPCGLRMDDKSVRVAIGLWLGAPIGHPHQCCHCGADVDKLDMHGLSCQWSPGRLPRLAAVNDIIFPSLTSAKVPPICKWSSTGCTNLMEKSQMGFYYFHERMESFCYGI